MIVFDVRSPLQEPRCSVHLIIHLMADMFRDGAPPPPLRCYRAIFTALPVLPISRRDPMKVSFHAIHHFLLMRQIFAAMFHICYLRDALMFYAADPRPPSLISTEAIVNILQPVISSSAMPPDAAAVP